MFDISFSMGMFPIKIGRNAKWVHLFLIDFDDFLTIYLIFESKSPFSMVKVFLSGNTIYLRKRDVMPFDQH